MIDQPKVITGGKLDGISFCFTGVRDKDGETKITDQGGKISSGVNARLTYLVCKDPNSSSSKMVKAKELGVKVISLQDAQKIYG